MSVPEVPLYTHSGGKVYRVISTRYPTIHLFEDVADAEAFDALYALESLTNDRLREEAGDLALIPREERIYGPGCAHIMSSFTHINPAGGRFNSGLYGAYYCADAEKTAILEVKYHRERFFRESRISEASYSEERVLINRIHPNPIHSIIGKRAELPNIYHPCDYTHSQQLATQLRTTGSWGLSYNSVRHREGICHALFKPTALTPCIESKKLRFYWDGKKVHQIEEIKLYKI